MPSGFGLFYRDTCDLGGYALALHGTKTLLLMAAEGEGSGAQIELTNSALSMANGVLIPDHKLSMRRGKRGRLLAPVWDGTVLGFCYEGADGVRRSLLVDFSTSPLVAPRTCEHTTAHFELCVAPHARHELAVRFRVDERLLTAQAPARLKVNSGGVEARK